MNIYPSFDKYIHLVLSVLSLTCTVGCSVLVMQGWKHPTETPKCRLTAFHALWEQNQNLTECYSRRKDNDPHQNLCLVSEPRDGDLCNSWKSSSERKPDGYRLQWRGGGACWERLMDFWCCSRTAHIMLLPLWEIIFIVGQTGTDCSVQTQAQWCSLACAHNQTDTQFPSASTSWTNDITLSFCCTGMEMCLQVSQQDKNFSCSLVLFHNVYLKLQPASD